MQQKLLKTKTMQVIEGRLDKPLEIWLREEYVERERLLEEIAADLGVVTSTVSKWLAQLGIPARAPGTRTKAAA